MSEARRRAGASRVRVGGGVRRRGRRQALRGSGERLQPAKHTSYVYQSNNQCKRVAMGGGCGAAAGCARARGAAGCSTGAWEVPGGASGVVDMAMGAAADCLQPDHGPHAARCHGRPRPRQAGSAASARRGLARDGGGLANAGLHSLHHVWVATIAKCNIAATSVGPHAIGDGRKAAGTRERHAKPSQPSRGVCRRQRRRRQQQRCAQQQSNQLASCRLQVLFW